MLGIPLATRYYVNAAVPRDCDESGKALAHGAATEQSGALLAIDDAHTTVARLFGLIVDVRRHGRRFEVARHVVHVARRRRRGVLALGGASHDVRRLATTAAVQGRDLVTDAVRDREGQYRHDHRQVAHRDEHRVERDVEEL